MLTPGEGYWIKSFQKTRSGKLVVDCPDTAPQATVSQAQGCASSNGCFAIGRAATLGAKKHLVGNPFPRGIDWSRARVRIDGATSTVTPTQAAGLATSGNANPAVLRSQFRVWNGTSYDTYSDTAPSATNGRPHRAATAGKKPLSDMIELGAATRGWRLTPIRSGDWRRVPRRPDLW